MNYHVRIYSTSGQILAEYVLYAQDRKQAEGFGRYEFQQTHPGIAYNNDWYAEAYYIR